MVKVITLIYKARSSFLWREYFICYLVIGNVPLVIIYWSDTKPYLHLHHSIFYFQLTCLEAGCLYTDTEHSWYLGLKVSHFFGRWPGFPATKFLLSTSLDISMSFSISLTCSSWAFSGRRCFQFDIIIGILPEVSPIRQRDWTVPCNYI